MARGALNWQTLNIPFTEGVETKLDPRFSSPPTLDIARDVQFEQIGGLQTRPPMAAMSNTIVGGGTLANCRRFAKVNGELCVFTDTGFYSYNAQLASWVLRGTHLAVAVDERTAFATSGDQIDVDRAELNGTILYAWTEGTTSYWAALDKTTGSVLVSPSSIGGLTSRPRLIALATKIMLFVTLTGTGILAWAIDPAAPSIGAGTPIAGSTVAPYDVVRAGTQDLVVGAFQRAVTTSYTAFTITPALSITTSTKARTCDGPIAVATIPDGTKTQVVRGNGTNIQGDLLTTSSLADIFTGQAIGTASVSLQQVTVAFSTVLVGGFFVAHAFWSRAEATTGTAGSFDHGSVDTNNSVGSSSSLSLKLGLGSRAFAALGRVFVWTAFQRDNEVTGLSGAVAVGVRAQLQNTYYLYRDDGFLVGKALFDVGGGHGPSTGRLPGVAATTGTGLDFAWGATRRRVLDLGGTDHTGFASRSPIDVTFSFDSNQSRRSAGLGRTLYITDSIPLQYDGIGLYEVGFLIYPYNFFVTNGGGGSIAAGDYVYKSTLSWLNGAGEREHSTTAMGAKITAPGANKNAIQTNALNVTKKSNAQVAPTMDVWRTAVSPNDDSPFYKVSGNDPTVLAGSGTNNGYVPNDINSAVLPSTGFFVLNDSFDDATLTTKEKNPENGSILEPLAPPGASIIWTTDTRVFLADIAGDPDAVWYSRLRNEGEVASFHDGNRILVPRPGGDITSIWFQDDVLYVGRQYAVYAIPGVGFDNTGQGQNFGPARTIPGNVGPVSQEALVTTEVGTLFKSAKGWQLLDRGGQVRYLGGPPSSFDTDTVLAMHDIATKHQVRILNGSRLLLWDYRGLVDVDAQGSGKWAEWTISDGLDAIVWNGTYLYLTATGPKQEQASYSGLTYGQDVEMSWLKLADLQGFGKVGETMVLGEYRSACLLRFRAARDYQYDGAGNPVYFDDRAWPAAPAVIGSALQVRYTPKLSQCESFKLRITAVTESTRATLATITALPIKTSGTNWAATWAAANTGSPGISFPGEMGNALTMSIAFQSGAAAFDVRDHFTYNTTLGRWVEDLGNIGVLVTGSGTITVAQLEAAIAAGTTLATLQTPDATPSKTIDVASYVTAGGYPTTAAGVAAIVPGGTFDHGWLCDELSGNLAPVFGGVTLTASGSGIIYGDTGTSGTADRAIGFSPSTTGKFSGNAALFDIGSNTDELVVAWVGKWNALPTAFGQMFGKASGSFGNGWSMAGRDGAAMTLEVGPGGDAWGASVAGASAFMVGLWHVGIAVIDRSGTDTVRFGVRDLLGTTTVISAGATGINGSSATSGSNFTIGSGDWVAGNDNFRLAALYVGKGPGVAAGLAATLSSALTTFAAAFGGSGAFSGGTYGSPTGEAVRLTGIALKVGIEQGNLYGRLPAGQKV